MENDLDKDEFELFLKQKADQHKLYPSDSAWNGIFNSLHPGMRWFKVGGSLLILSSLFFVFQQTSFFNSSKSIVNKSALSSDSNATHASISVKPGLPFSASLPDTHSQNPSVNSVEINNSIVGKFGGSGVTNSIATGKHIPVQTPDASNPFQLNAATTPFPNASQFSKSFSSSSTDSETENIPAPSNNALTSGSTIEKELKTAVVAHQVKGFLLTSNPGYWQHLPIVVNIPSKHISVTYENKQTEQTDVAITRELKTSEVKVATHTDREDVTLKNINWLQEMAAIKLTTHKKNPFNLQFYFSPTVSFRRLADNQNSSHTGIFSPPVSTRDLNINNYVNHSSAVGAEIGSNILFSASRNLILKTGLQLNYTRYNIKAYRYSNEKTSIVLNTTGPVPDTLSSYTSIRNFSGYSSEQLQNQYLQLSVPIGAELKIIGNKKLQFSVAGSIQPTILLYSDTYLLSTNYLNYTKEPSLVRKWNVNSAFEAFLSYKTGALRWQLGPQFRYQLMSSYNDRYPIKEYLFEYGVKIGVSKTIR